MTSPLRVHVLYEHDATDPRPYGSSHLRLLRPLSHPAVGPIVATFGRDPPPPDQAVDCVVVDRLWRRDASPADAEQLLRGQREMGRSVVAAMDDDLLRVDSTAAGLAGSAGAVAEAFIRGADGLLVTTEALAERFAPMCARIRVVPNALDERLLSSRAPRPRAGAFVPRPLVVGIMGTRTHDLDVEVVREAWIKVRARRSDIVLEIVGTVRDEAPWLELGVTFRAPPAPETEYPLFMAWWSTVLDWDVGLAPLVDSPFNAAKSDVKALDFACIGAAGIFSRVRAYEGIRNGETGLLCDNTPDAWAASIERLADDDALRVNLARLAGRELWARRILAHRAPDWTTALHELAHR